MKAHELQAGATILVPDAASTLYTQAYRFVIREVAPTSDPQIMGLRGRALTPTGLVLGGQEPARLRTTRVRHEHCTIVEHGRGALCAQCPELGVWSDVPAHGSLALPVLRCDGHQLGGAIHLDDVVCAPYVIDFRGGGVQVACPCGYQAALPPQPADAGAEADARMDLEIMSGWLIEEHVSGVKLLTA